MNQNLIIKQLKKGNPKAISLLYDYFPVVKSYVLKNNGNKSEAKDVFQESLIILFKKLQSNNFSLNVKIETFVFGICKNLWFEELRKRNKTNGLIFEENLSFETEVKNHLEEEKKYEKLDFILDKLGEKCLQILQLFYYKSKSMQEIADILDYKNMNTVKTQKYKCLERAKKMADVNFVELKNRVS